MAKQFLDKSVESFLVRWTKRDLQNDMPRRLNEALEASGAERAKLLRSLLVQWVEDIEEHGPAQIRDAVATINERPGDYGNKPSGAANKRKKKS